MANVLDLSHVTVVRDQRAILDDVDWRVAESDRWVILGPNGAGKSTLLQVASANMHPSKGSVEVLDERVGRVDVFELRPRIGIASTAVGRRIPAHERVLDAVMTAAYAVTGRWNEAYDELDERRAHRVLGEWRLDHLAERTFGTLSDGEQKRVQIARAVMTDPEILMLDEPTASLDLGSREELLQLLSHYALSPEAPAMVMITHHVEEIPAGMTHAMLMRDGAIVAAGPIGSVLTSELLTETFGVPLSLERFADGRYAARAETPAS